MASEGESGACGLDGGRAWGLDGGRGFFVATGESSGSGIAAARARSCLLGERRYPVGVPSPTFFSNSLTLSLTVDIGVDEGGSTAEAVAEVDAYAMLSAESACLSARRAGRATMVERVCGDSSSGTSELCDAARDGGSRLRELESSSSLADCSFAFACCPGRLGLDRTGCRAASDLPRLDDEEAWLSTLCDDERVRCDPLASDALGADGTRYRCSAEGLRDAERVFDPAGPCAGPGACDRVGASDSARAEAGAAAFGRNPGRGFGLEGPPSAGMSR